MKDYVAKLPAYEKLYADASVLAIERSALVDFERYFSRYKGELEKKKASLLADNRLRYGVEKAHLYERSLIKSALAGGGEVQPRLVSCRHWTSQSGVMKNGNSIGIGSMCLSLTMILLIHA